MPLPSAPTPRNFADRFELKSQAGTGGMGTVYQAIDRHTGRVVAVKILHGKSVTDAARFNQEASLLAELRHPGIVGYVDHGATSHGESYIAMEWLAGETLEERLMRGPLPAGAVARMASRVLEALAAAHERGIIHRDIKPSNIFLIDWRLDETRVLDFGIARRVFDPKRFTKVGSTVGTPMYTAPEQARADRDVDGRADIFSLGCVLFECLSGEPPFSGDSPMEVMAKICIGAPPRLAPRCPGVPAAIEKLVESMLAQDRRQRPPEAGKLAGAFAAVARELASADETPAGDPVAPVRTTLGDGEQRVMCALLIAPRRAVGDPRRSADPRPDGRRSGSPPWFTQTVVASPPLNDTGELDRALAPFGGHVDRLLDRSLIVTVRGGGHLRDQAVRIARCALALRARMPTGIMAVATGRAALLAQLPVGPLVDRLAGLLDSENAAVIRIDELTARLLPARFRIEGGLDKKLVGEGQGDDQPRDIAGRPAPFVGRDRELASLLALYRECADEGVARAALMLGAAGVGKTRLRQELIRAIHADAARTPGPPPLVLLAAGELAVSEDRHPLLGGLLAAAGIDAGQPAAPTGRDWTTASAATEVRDAWVDFLRARCAEGPVVLVLEHLERADPACLQLVDAALAALKHQPLYVIGLGRPEVEDQFPGLWSDRSVERVRLPPLTRKAGQLLVRHFISSPSPEIEAFVLDRWEGNPFLLEELVAGAIGGHPLVPETVLGMVEARFHDLDTEVRRVLRAASVFGDEPFAPEGVVALLGEKCRRDLNPCLEVLAGRDILQRCMNDGEVAFRFQSPLVREAAYRMLAPGDRALARRQARTWLENAGRTLPEFLVVPFSQSTVIAAAG